MTPVEQRLLLNKIEKQIALLQNKLRTLGDSEQEELNSLKKLIQTLIKNEREKERKREREQGTPYQIFFYAMDELVEKPNDVFVTELPPLIKNFCHHAGVTIACYRTKNFPSFESAIKNLNPAQAQQLINGLRNQILSEYEESTPEHNDINALILKIGEILRTKGTNPTMQALPDKFFVLEEIIRALAETTEQDPQTVVTELPGIITSFLNSDGGLSAVSQLKIIPSFKQCVAPLDPVGIRRLLIELEILQNFNPLNPDSNAIPEAMRSLCKDIIWTLKECATNEATQTLIQQTQNTLAEKGTDIDAYYSTFMFNLVVFDSTSQDLLRDLQG
jgi:hypothetical protein